MDQIRLLLEEQSDLGQHCLQHCLLKYSADDKADNNFCVWRLEVNFCLSAYTLFCLFLFFFSELWKVEESNERQSDIRQDHI